MTEETHDQPGAGELGTLRNWQRGLRINHIANHRAAARDAKLGLALGVTVVVFSTIVGTAIFTTLNQSPSTAAKTIAGLLSVAAAVFGALQTFLGFPQRQAAHHEAAVKYGALRREIESILGLPPGAQALRQLLSDLRLRWDEIDADAPAVSQRSGVRPLRAWSKRRPLPDTKASSRKRSLGASPSCEKQGRAEVLGQPPVPLDEIHLIPVLPMGR